MDSLVLACNHQLIVALFVNQVKFANVPLVYEALLKQGVLFYEAMRLTFVASIVHKEDLVNLRHV